MKLINIFDEKEVFYDTGNIGIYSVTLEFWNTLKAGKIKYLKSVEDGDMRVLEETILDLKMKKFETIFKQIANSEMGKEVMMGLRPVSTVL